MHTAALCENSVIWTDDFSLCLHLTITYRLQLMCVFTGSGENETHQHVNDEVNEPLWVQIFFFFIATKGFGLTFDVKDSCVNTEIIQKW